MLWTTTVPLIAVGLICIAAGYWLFCESPGLWRRATGRTIFWRSILPGALLALFGTGLVTAQTKTLLAHRPRIQRHAPATEDTSWPGAAPHRVRNSSV